MMTKIKKIKQERFVENFSGISSSHGIDIEYTKSDVYSLKIKAKAKLIEQIETTVESGILKINWKNEFIGFLKAKFLKQSAVVVYISAPILNRIDLSTGVDLYAETIKSEDGLEIIISNGSGLKAKHIESKNVSFNIRQASGVEVESVKASNILIENSAHSDVELENIHAENINLNASGFSDTNLSGIVNALSINAENSSDTDLKNLIYRSSTINHSKGSSIYK